MDAVSPEKSASQNIEEMCFRQGAILTTEFQNIFASLFKNPVKYESIITALSTKTKGMTRRELSELTGIKTGGSLTKTLNELAESEFIAPYTPFNRKSRDTIYRLSDFYSLFYLKFIKNNTNYDEGIWVNAIDSPSQRAWAGYAFEQICLATYLSNQKRAGDKWHNKSSKSNLFIIFSAL